MNFLDTYPEILTVNQIAEILGVTVNTVYGMPDLAKIRIGKGRGVFRCKKTDLIDCIESRKEEVNIVNANQKKERHGKMGVSTLLPWKELQKLQV
jgi:hypothetical protein